MTATHTIAYTETGLMAMVSYGQDITTAIQAEAVKVGMSGDDLDAIKTADVIIVHEDDEYENPVFKGFDIENGELTDGCNGPYVAIRA